MSGSASVQDNLRAVRAALKERTDNDVSIVAVVKKQPIDRVREALSAGLREIANNYEQDGSALQTALKDPHIRWHFVGQVQSRKAKLLVDYDLVQSLERTVVAEAWQRILGPDGRCIDALIEVNVGGESQKAGVKPEELSTLLRDMRRYSAVRVRGLMAMVPATESVEDRRPFFRTMREIFEAQRSDGHFDTLSMGTSQDYLVAVEEGATMVRLGESLLGERPV